MKKNTVLPTNTNITSSQDRGITLSYFQQRLYNINKTVPTSVAYNTSIGLKLDGKVNYKSLTLSINTILSRHNILATYFRRIEGEIYKYIDTKYKFRINEIDLTKYKGNQQASKINEEIQIELKRQTDLSSPSLLRVTMLKICENEHVLLLTTHTIISGYRASWLLVKDIFEEYEYIENSSPPKRKKLKHSVCLSSNGVYLAGKHLSYKLDYWMRKLAGELTFIELPADHKRLSAHKYNGDILSSTIEADLLKHLKSSSEEIGVSLYAVLFAAYKVILFRYTGVSDIIVGTPMHNINNEDVDCLMGIRDNEFPIRSELSSDIRFNALAQELSKTLRDANENKDIPFESIIKELQHNALFNTLSLFSTVFTLQDSTVKDISLKDIEITTLSLHNGTSKYDLYLSLCEDNNELAIDLEYDSDLFKRSTIKRFTQHYINLLKSIVSDTSKSVSDLTMLDEYETNTLVNSWNRTETEYSKDKTLPELYSAQANMRPDKVALVYSNETLTYKQLDEESNQLGHYLTKLGVGQGSIVGVLMERSNDLIITLLAILKTGGCYAPLDSCYPNERLRYMLDDIDADVVITQRSTRKTLLLKGLIEVCFDELISEIKKEKKSALVTNIGPQDLAYVMHTSGTTGKPKGVLISHQSINRLVSNTNYADFNDKHVFLHFAPISFDASTFEIWGALLNGAKLIIAPSWQTTIDELSRTISESKVTTLWLTAALFHQMVDYYPEVLMNLKQLLAGGDILSPTHVKKLFNMNPECVLINGYGPTEGTTFSCCKTIVQGELSDSKSIPIGKPISNTQVYILDSTLNLQPIGAHGELYIGGDGLCKGYLNNPEQTNEKFIKNPFTNNVDDRLYRTGDIVRYLINGDIEFIGRIDNQVKIRGYRIEPLEIEQCLKQHPLVRDAVIKINISQQDDKRILAYIVPDTSSTSLNEQTDKEHVAQWKSLYEETYSKSTAHNDAEFNIIGWDSSYTGHSLSDNEMKDWLDGCVTRILSYDPENVLEIGFGTGLLLFKIAPYCQQYDAWDFSAKALEYVHEHAKTLGLKNIKLSQRTADNFNGIKERNYNSIIINSVVQYFPDINYLENVIAMSINSIAAGGTIFLGDIRNYSLLNMFHTSVEFSKASNNTTNIQVLHRAEQQLQLETELLISPEFFMALKNTHSRISHVDILYKRGINDNELTKYRYDVVLHIDSDKERIDGKWVEWQDTTDSVALFLKKMTKSNLTYLAIKNVYNARIDKDNYVLNTLRENKNDTDISVIKNELINHTQNGVHPESWYKIIKNMPFDVDLRWSGLSDDMYYDVLIYNKGTMPSHVNYPFNLANADQCSKHVNTPSQVILSNNLIPKLRQHIEEQLPKFMHPSNYIVMDNFLITENGKIDRNNLPRLDDIRPEMAEVYAPPSTDIEIKMSIIWQEIISINQIGIYDNFFKLGGHSLLAIQVVSQIMKVFSIKMDIRKLFEYPTIIELSILVDRKLNEDNYESA